MSLQYDQKVTKTQKEVTVDPYFWSAISYHPVDTLFAFWKGFELLMDAFQNKCPPKGCILILTQGEHFFSNLDLQIYGNG